MVAHGRTINEIRLQFLKTSASHDVSTAHNSNATGRCKAADWCSPARTRGMVLYAGERCGAIYPSQRNRHFDLARTSCSFVLDREGDSVLANSGLAVDWPDTSSAGIEAHGRRKAGN